MLEVNERPQCLHSTTNRLSHRKQNCPLIPFQPWRFSPCPSLTAASDFWRHLFTSLAAEANGAELVGPTLQPDLRELGLTGEAILTYIQTTPEIEAPFNSRDEL